MYDIAKRAEYDIPSLDEVGVGVSDGKISDLNRQHSSSFICKIYRT